MDISRYWRLIVALGQEANVDNLGMTFRYHGMLGVLIRITLMSTNNIHFNDKKISIKYPHCFFLSYGKRFIATKKQFELDTVILRAIEFLLTLLMDAPN